MGDLQTGDVLLVDSLSRAGRSLRHLLELVEEFRDRDRDVGFESLRERIDSTSATGAWSFTCWLRLPSSSAC
jgi:DNA invertase Pin-like site-specific DNA recombinase